MTATPDPHGISPGGYLSTACRHGDHANCRVTCKYCPATCVCGCGRCGKPETMLERVEALEKRIEAQELEARERMASCNCKTLGVTPPCPIHDPSTGERRDMSLPKSVSPHERFSC